MDNVRRYFETVEDALFSHRYSTKANFASQQFEAYLSLGAFGTGALFVNEVPGDGLRYRAVHLSEIFLAENEAGRIDTIFRKTEMTHRQMLQRWGKDRVSPKVASQVEAKPDETVEILHVVLPSAEYNDGEADRPFASLYMELSSRHVLSENGYFEFPYIVSRYVTGPREVYGRSPAMTALADIKMLNEMSKTSIKAAQKAVDPPLLIADDGVILPLNLNPGKPNFVRMDGRSQSPVQFLQPNSRFDISETEQERRRRTINDAFLVTLFQILVDSPQMTATEVLERAREKGALLARTVGRQQSEALGPMIERELGIHARMGVLPPLPPELVEATGEFDIEYVSPMSRAMRAEEAVGILRTLESVQQIAAVEPAVLDIFDGEAIARSLADINGVPRRMIWGEDATAAKRAAREQQQQMAMVAQAAPQIADVAANALLQRPAPAA
ncbi:MAG: phage head-tail adapter protein [Rhodospirillaceae bacterium]|nr:phage head-tail adapter protein [Rhodospirillaceae bacterium]